MNKQQRITLEETKQAFRDLCWVASLECEEPEELEGVLNNIQAVETDIINLLTGVLQVKGNMVFRPNPASIRELVGD